MKQEIDPKDIIKTYTRKDFDVTCFRGSGPGGQHRNKTETYVRITHIETGLVGLGTEYKSQHQNKKSAFHKLAKKLLNHHKILAAREKIKNDEVVRTYHGVDNRVKDNESGFQQTYKECLDDLSGMIENRNQHKQLGENS